MKHVTIAAAIAAGLAYTPALARDLPAPLQAALSAAEAAGAAAPRLAFTQSFEKDGQRLVMRFDPRAAPGTRWSLVEPADPTALSKEAKDAYAEIAEDDDADRALVVDEPFNLIGPGAIDERVDGERIVYSFVGPGNAGVSGSDEDGEQKSAKIGKYLRAELTIDSATSRLVSYRLNAPEAFKPAAVAKITRLDVDMTFASVGETGVQHLAVMRQDVAGKALFQSFEEAITTVVTDVLPIDPTLVIPTPED